MAYEFGVGEYETEDGKKVEIVAVRKGNLIGIMHNEQYTDGMYVTRWNLDGTYRTGCHQRNLLPPKQKRTVWINVYGRCGLIHHDSEESARRGRTNGTGKVDRDCIACVKVELEFTPGEGL